jgi:hypothetical protein
MNVFARRVSVFLSTLLLLSLAACGGQPVAFADLPMLPDAAPLEEGTNTIADSVSSSFKESLSGENVGVELKLYAVPAETSWEQIKTFYTDQLAATDWKSDERIAQDSDAFKTVGWTRGGLASEQGLAVGYGPDLLGEGAFLMVALISE